MGVLRLLLALSVVNAHGDNLLGFPLLLPDLAVQAFYLISGFYMALVLHEKYQPGKSTYLEFITNRFLRIFPSYYVVLLLTIIVLAVGWHYGVYDLPRFVQNLARLDWSAKLFFVLSHLALFGQDFYLFLGLDGQGDLHFDPNFRANDNQFLKFMLVPQAWSLSLELCFYLIAPFFVRRSAATLAIIIASSLLVRFILLWFGWKNDPWAYRFFPSELALFFCGAAAYRIYRAVRIGKMNTQTWLGWGTLGIATGAALLMSRYPAGNAILLNVGCVVAIFLVLPFLFKLTQRSKIDNYIGELSYPMYLCHMLVIWSFGLMQIPNGIGRNIGILSVTLMLSIILYGLVDRNIDRYRHRRFLMAHAADSTDNKLK
jgi:peptidoglycan/LPS O-acetylase OafA/YrhL